MKIFIDTDNKIIRFEEDFNAGDLADFIWYNEYNDYKLVSVPVNEDPPQQRILIPSYKRGEA